MAKKLTQCSREGPDVEACLGEKPVGEYSRSRTNEGSEKRELTSEMSERFWGQIM